MSGLSAAEQTQINLSVGGVVVSNCLSYLTMGFVLAAGECLNVLILPSVVLTRCLSPAWTYFSKFPADKWWFKALSHFVCIWTYNWTVTNYANPAALTLTHWAFPAEAFLLATCGLVVQLFYAWRVWMVSGKKNWIVPVVIACLSILGWCIVCWIVRILATHKLIADLTLVIPVVYIWLGGSVGADVIITGSLIYYLDLRFRTRLLKKQQIQPGFHSPGRFRQIIVRTVECNFLSLFAQAVSVGLFNNNGVGFYFVITDMTLAKVYTFSLLVSLNSRHSDHGHGTSGTGQLNALGNRRSGTLPSTQVSVHIQRERIDDWQGQTKEAFNDYESDSVAV
ncbi:hypothetical protein BT96DRAFT_1004001 [Gymnopus androsaceus JB14]|uniref:DUF6534 domain-containing protein n=1 Tax=Gymnopus androsaceus JB14 TaxID=1447944 RepID=A0A6A4GTL9_9AGAR|nr:hypothetical protein BT96DRAFT_1004001 [Gymnopus androsaceus JB14]